MTILLNGKVPVYQAGFQIDSHMSNHFKGLPRVVMILNEYSQSDIFCYLARESTHLGQSVHVMAC